MNAPSISSTPSSAPAVSAAEAGAALALTIRRILVPIDFSEHSLRSLRYAVPMARDFGAALTLLHVVEPVLYPADFGYAPVTPPLPEDGMQRDAEARLKALAAQHVPGTVPVESLVRLGRAFQEIVSAAQEIRADLIVVTTHGYTGLKHVLLGSNAERVVRHAPCPVLCVREPEHAG